MDAGRARRVGCRLLVVLAVAYAPIALTAAWSAFVPGAPHLQESIDRALGGEPYAEGAGSVHDLRAADYADHRMLMLLHIVLGVVCLLLAVRQVVGRPRRHRAIGRAHLVLVTFSMLAALLFLVATDPGPGPGQAAFRAQLWVLAASTLATAWLAAVEAARGHLRAHRAWMTLHVAFLLTAPALRLTWMMLAPLLADRDMLTNIESGAVVLAVVAPAGGVTLAVLGAARDGGDPAERTTPSGPVLGPLAAGIVGLGVVVTAASGSAAADQHVWFHVVPAVAVLAACLTVRGRAGRVLLLGAAAIPWAVLLVAVPVSMATDRSVGVLTGLMVAPGLPLAAALAFVLARRAAGDRASLGRTSKRLLRGEVGVRPAS
jgi:hypothetical protein